MVSRIAKTTANGIVGVKLSHGRKVLVTATTKLQKERTENGKVTEKMEIIILGKARCQGLSGMMKTADGNGAKVRDG